MVLGFQSCYYIFHFFLFIVSTCWFTTPFILGPPSPCLTIPVRVDPLFFCHLHLPLKLFWPIYFQAPLKHAPTIYPFTFLRVGKLWVFWTYAAIHFFSFSILVLLVWSLHNFVSTVVSSIFEVPLGLNTIGYTLSLARHMLSFQKPEEISCRFIFLNYHFVGLFCFTSHICLSYS